MNLLVKLTLLAVDVFLDGGAVTESLPEVRTGDLLSSLAEKQKRIFNLISFIPYIGSIEILYIKIIFTSYSYVSSS